MFQNKDSVLADRLYKSFYDQILSQCDDQDLPLKSCETSDSNVSVPKSAPSNPPKPKKLVIKDLILKRPNENRRCFVPGDSNSALLDDSGLITFGPSAESKMEEDSGFISFGTGVKTKSQPIQENKAVQEEDDDSDSDLWSAEPPPKMKKYKPLFQPLKLKKIKPKY